VAGKIYNRLYNFLEGRRCEAFIAPFDVRLPIYDENDDDTINVVQPDVVVYCNQLGVDKKGGRAAPDIAIEILSPSSAKTDKVRKFRLYEKAGVKEYWIVDSESEFVEVYVHDGVKFLSQKIYCENEIISSVVLDGFQIENADIFLTPGE
jgi:Uma2 family endonuclease